MFSIKSIISRADEFTIQGILGKQLIKLIQTMDPKYRKTNELKKLIFQIHSEQAFLEDIKLREILINLLKIDEVKLVSNTLGYLTNTKYKDEYVYLKNKRFVSGSEDELLFYNFFSVSLSKYNKPNSKDGQNNDLEKTGNYQLFSHQRHAVQDIKSKLNQFPHRVLLHMPTGSGKTRTTMDLICDYLRNTEPSIVIWLASTEELCLQATQEMEKAWSFLGNRKITIGKLWGDIKIDQVFGINDGIIVAGFQKLTQYLSSTEGLKLFSKLASKISFIVVDEAHQSIAERYKSIIEIIFNSNHNTRLLGLSATPGRTWNDIEEDQKLADFYNRQKVTLKIEGFTNPVDYLVEEQYIASVNYKTLEYENNNELSLLLINKFQINNMKDFSKEILSILGQDANRNIKIIGEVIRLTALRHLVLAKKKPPLELEDKLLLNSDSFPFYLKAVKEST